MLGDSFDAALHQVEHRPEFSFHNGSHRVQFVIETAFIDELNTFGNVAADTFAHSERRNRKLQKYHGEEA